MIFLGADPDLHTSALAAVDDNGGVVCVHVFRSEGSKGKEAVVDMVLSILENERLIPQKSPPFIVAGAVECPEIYHGGKHATKNTKDIKNLAAVAGALLLLLGRLQRIPAPPTLYHPTPIQWKGNVPKAVHQARILGSNGIGVGFAKHSDYCEPLYVDWPGTSTLKRADWKHVVDAIGLALWCRDEYMEDQARKQRLK